MMKIAAYILMFFLPCVAIAQNTTTESADVRVTEHTKATADSLYISNKYSEAASLYEEIIRTSGVNADIYYNLGNAYYKEGNIAKAILNYERARLLNPSDDDIVFNLNLAKSKIVDKESEPYEIFFMQWIKSIINLLPMSSWAFMAISMFIILLISILLFLFTSKIGVKKASFIVALFSFLITIFANIAAWNHYSALTKREYAIIMQPSVTAKSTPDASGTDLFVIHEGRKVKLSDDSMKEWKEIELEDGTIGWVPKEAIEVI